MAKHMPPVPPAGRSPQDGDQASPDDDTAQLKQEERKRNLAEQGQQGNIKQNTTRQAYLQDR